MPEITAKQFDELESSINKKYGKGAIFRSDDGVEPVETASTGSIALDKALGIKGLPFGKIIEIYGPEASGKTTLAIQTVANAQKKDPRAVGYIDAEHAMDLKYAKILGLDLDRLFFSQPSTAEEGLDIANMLISSGLVSMVVIDSVSALLPRAELEGDIGDSHVGLIARLMGQGLRKMKPICGEKNASLIFINQLRMKVGVMFGNPETTSGGLALKFFADVRLDIRKSESVKMDAKSGEVRVKVVKNKLAVPYRDARFHIEFGVGIDTLGELVDIASTADIIKKSGTWYSYNGERVGQGRDNVRAWLAQNPAVATAIREQVMAVDIPVEVEVAKED
jgi:recombination protein RecA